MKRLNSAFIFLILVIGLLSISYIWKSEADKQLLKKTIDEQTIKIASLNKQLSEIKNSIKTLETSFGIVTGIVKLNKTINVKDTIVCAQDKFSIKEFCTDELTQTDNKSEYSYSLEIPKGKYLIYAVSPTNSNKAYYSKVQKCVDDNCENNQKILLEINENETQKDINLYF